jgi:LEA14-like dessication related protein
MHNIRRRILIAIAGLILAGCAGVPAERFESPQLSLTSLRMLPSDGVARRFFIGMRVTNPNRTPLNVGDLSYEVDFEGQPFLAGTARNLARIPPHAESEIELQAGPGPQSDPRLLDRLLDDPRRERLQFDLRATLRLGGVHPPLTLEESGDLRLTPTPRQ